MEAPTVSVRRVGMVPVAQTTSMSAKQVSMQPGYVAVRPVCSTSKYVVKYEIRI